MKTPEVLEAADIDSFKNCILNMMMEGKRTFGKYKPLSQRVGFSGCSPLGSPFDLFNLPTLSIHLFPPAAIPISDWVD